MYKCSFKTVLYRMVYQMLHENSLQITITFVLSALHSYCNTSYSWGSVYKIFWWLASVAVEDPINKQFCAISQAPDLDFPTSYVVVILHIQWVGARCDCSLWWNCWLYIFSVHNTITMSQVRFQQKTFFTTKY